MRKAKYLHIAPPLRTQDVWGSGEFGASRGNRIHKGMDFACAPHSVIRAMSNGYVTKIGHPYSDDLSYLYVQVTTDDGYNERYFYVSPIVELGDRVDEGDRLGSTQVLGTRYAGITEHLHFEVTKGADHLDPADYMGGYI